VICAAAPGSGRCQDAFGVVDAVGGRTVSPGEAALTADCRSWRPLSSRGEALSAPGCWSDIMYIGAGMGCRRTSCQREVATRAARFAASLFLHCRTSSQVCFCLQIAPRVPIRRHTKLVFALIGSRRSSLSFEEAATRHDSENEHGTTNENERKGESVDRWGGSGILRRTVVHNSTSWALQAGADFAAVAACISPP
jgi:hypothetical protein